DSFSFFFQAEDGIRDPLVTGVQTCALPICTEVRFARAQPGRALSRRAERASEPDLGTSGNGGRLRRCPGRAEMGTTPRRAQGSKIGRASCRERVELTGVADG